MPRKRVLSEEEKKGIAILRASNEMLNKTRKETIQKDKKDKDSVVAMIDKAKQENIAEMAKIDSEIASEEAKKERDVIENKGNGSDTKNVFDLIDQLDEESEINTDRLIEDEKITESDYANEETDEILEDDTEVNEKDPVEDGVLDIDNPKNLQYDIVPLPSNGQCYPSKTSRVAVAYLTAESENLITSPQLYRDDMIIDALLKYHIISKNIKAEDLVQGDIDAIMVWLRATGYGTDYPIKVTDPETDKEFNTVADLSKLKNKEFKLIGNKNGQFEFTLPLTKKKIVFKLLSRKEERLLKRVNNLESEGMRRELVKESYETLRAALREERTMTNTQRQNLESSLNTIHKWSSLAPKEELKINHLVTNRLEMMIQSIDDITDKREISNVIRVLPARDCRSLMTYIASNEPGVDWNISVERPESLGGGSIPLFLEWTSSAFLNVSES